VVETVKFMPTVYGIPGGTEFSVTEAALTGKID
jgi:hypothetical protein